MEETSKQNDTQQSIKKKEHYLDIEGINSSLISLEDIKRQLYTKSYESQIINQDLGIALDELSKYKINLEEQIIENNMLRQELRFIQEQLKKQDYQILKNSKIENIEQFLNSQQQERVQQLKVSLQEQILSMKQNYHAHIQEKEYQYQKEKNEHQVTITEQKQTISRLEIFLKEKDDLIKNNQVQIEVLSKQLQSQEDKYKQLLVQQEETINTQVKSSQMELSKLQVSYSRKLEELESQFKSIAGQLDGTRQNLKQVESERTSQSKQIQEYLLVIKQFKQKNIELERANREQISLIQKLNTQELNKQKTLLQNKIDSANSQLQMLQSSVNQLDQRVKEKDQTIKQLTSIREKENKENQLYLNEIELLKAQIKELINQKNLELEIARQGNLQNEASIINSYQENINTLEQQNTDLEAGYYQKKQENEILLSELDHLRMQLQNMNVHFQQISMENGNIKQALSTLQKQKEIENDQKEEIKRKEINQLKQYYETIKNQFEYENKNLRLMVDQKNKECEEWRAKFLRKQY